MNTTIESLVTSPLFFERNRVGRVYTGGKLFSGFFGDAPEDGFLPEEWVCSCVRALNRVQVSEHDGISVVKGTDILFSELLKSHRRELLGDRSELGVLVKLLDSSIRLPVQCHPDTAYSRRYFNSNHGKAESWVILDTRENACIYYGFRDKISKDDFAEAVRKSEEGIDAMSCLLNRIPVRKGDVYFIGARMIHAIGAGCLLLETQEPTDFTIQPERFCGDYRLDEQEMYMSLPHDTALDCFDYEIYGDRALALGRKKPFILSDDGRVRHEVLISYSDTPCFAVERVTLNGGRYTEGAAPAIYVVTEGEGKLEYGEGSRKIKKGDYFFAPHSINGKFGFSCEKRLEVTVCLPPVEGK